MIKRDEEIISLFKSAITITALADKFGVSKQRIQQILKREGVSSSEGGQRARSVNKAEQRYIKRDVAYLEKYGCTLSQYEEIEVERKRMQASGKTWQTTPLAAYYGQKSSAKYRGIPFNLTMWEWWTVWRESGKWAERGIGTGYVMCRKGDAGAYELGNVFIDTSVNNISFAKRKGLSLPLGVTYRPANKRNPYVALRSINGKSTYLGCFRTAEDAHCAYLVAVS